MPGIAETGLSVRRLDSEGGTQRLIDRKKRKNRKRGTIQKGLAEARYFGTSVNLKLD